MQFDERKEERGNSSSDLLYILFCLLLWKLCKDDSSKHDDTSKDFFSTQLLSEDDPSG